MEVTSEEECSVVYLTLFSKASALLLVLSAMSHRSVINADVIKSDSREPNAAAITQADKSTDEI